MDTEARSCYRNINSTVEGAKDNRYQNVKAQFNPSNVQHTHTKLSKSPHVKRKLSITSSLPCLTTKQITLVSEYPRLTAANTLPLSNLNFPRFPTPM
jgi:hypothetical protein